jgi:hypothetical protein
VKHKLHFEASNADQTVHILHQTDDKAITVPVTSTYLLCYSARYHRQNQYAAGRCSISYISD